MFLGIDTETSGLARDGLPPNDPSQPHLVQIGMRLWSTRWEPQAAVSLLIRPDGWSIEPEAERIHRISQARAERYGVPLPIALATLQGLVNAASIIFAHNMQFDRLVVTAALYRAKASGIWWAKRAGAMRCTMEEATPICQLPGRYGTFKHPSLEEAHTIMLPAEPVFVSRHDALTDIEAAARVFRELERRRAE